MSTWVDDIPKADAGWQHITLSAKHPDGANIRFSPLVDADNLAGKILHDSANGSLRGLANKVYQHSDGMYTWYPVHVLNNQQFNESIQLWFAAEAYVVNWGAYVNIPAPVDESQFFDVDFLGQPTIRIPSAHMSSVVEVLHALASYLNAKL